ncbi:cob(I)yrinic acid a,c-diamide adenosyltransferase [Psychrobacter sp. FDAARGOS_221]|uniref:cob(I)yrinic acid a,c-diamide adenosyltransferase n=1 Tax=Psychrobacter sp. FDAARGOS_221 TaxID=1975705 RepID=UPI000BB532DB|nr:cob(I)yrinic acid a,c-diamide adenosyltransferase [Psychrobacter sp. FDAARGOS_221]PNK59516.1 ATP:cob(I)alamin adenosyltransferase [Psychrobacter sp. FDAARGOS_221]
MGNRLSKIYTRTGDDGTTGMANGDRISKADQLFTVMGDVDELNAHIGMIAAHAQQLTNQANKADSINSDQPDLENILHSISIIQHLLFNIGGELAMPEYKGIEDAHIEWLESQIDGLNQYLLPLKDFILPAGSVLVSQTHIARTVCRRCERQAVSLRTQQPQAMSAGAAKLLNRLSDWLFVLARYCANLEQSNEVLWDKTILDGLTQ